MDTTSDGTTFSEASLGDTLDAREIAFFEAVLRGGGVISPSVDLRAAVGFSYPQVAEMLGYAPNSDLDYLRFRERQNLVEARFHDRVNLCPGCQHVTVNFREVCPQCSAADISFESVIHHFRCAFVGREEQFRRGVGLVCPKCQHSLRSLGKDYEKPTDLHFCRRCDSLFSEPGVHGLCLHCKKRFPQEERVVFDVVEFRLTAAVVPALRGQKWLMNYPPSVSDELPNVVSEEFLRVMLELEVRRAVRYKRPLSLVSLSTSVLQTSRERPRSFIETAQLYEFSEKLEKVRRNTDIVGRLRSGVLLFVLSETPFEGTKPMIRRMRETFAPLELRAAGVPVNLEEPQSPEELIQAAASALGAGA